MIDPTTSFCGLEDGDIMTIGKKSWLTLEQMTREGYQHVTNDEIKLYEALGSKNFYWVVDVAFRYAYYEAMFLGINNQTSDFAGMAYVKRRECVDRVLEMCRENSVELRENPRFAPATDEQIWHEIKMKYTQNPGEK